MGKLYSTEKNPIESFNNRPKSGHRSDGFLVVFLLQIIRAMMNTAAFIITEVQFSNLPVWIDVTRAVYGSIFIFVFIDLIVAYYFWTKRREAWGIAIGISVVLTTLPWSINVLTPIILLISTSEILLLFTPTIRKEMGVCQYTQKNPAQTRSPIYWMVIVVQLIKSTLDIIGGIILLQFYEFFEPISPGSAIWVFNIPFVPLAFVMGGIGFIVTWGLFKRTLWSYDITLAIAAMGTIEGLFAYSAPVFYISIFLVVLMLTKSAKTSFG